MIYASEVSKDCVEINEEKNSLRKAMKQFYHDNLLNTSKINPITFTTNKTIYLNYNNTSITDFINDKYMGELLSFIYNVEKIDSTDNDNVKKHDINCI